MYKMITGMVLLSKEEWAAVKQLRLAVQYLLNEKGFKEGAELLAEDALGQSQFIDREGGN